MIRELAVGRNSIRVSDGKRVLASTLGLQLWLPEREMKPLSFFVSAGRHQDGVMGERSY